MRRGQSTTAIAAGRQGIRLQAPPLCRMGAQLPVGLTPVQFGLRARNTSPKAQRVSNSCSAPVAGYASACIHNQWPHCPSQNSFRVLHYPSARPRRLLRTQQKAAPLHLCKRGHGARALPQRAAAALANRGRGRRQKAAGGQQYRAAQGVPATASLVMKGLAPHTLGSAPPRRGSRGDRHKPSSCPQDPTPRGMNRRAPEAAEARLPRPRWSVRGARRVVEGKVGGTPCRRGLPKRGEG